MLNEVSANASHYPLPVHAVERLVADEPLERLQPERELPLRQRALGTEAALAQPLEVLGRGVLAAVDDPQVLAPAALDGRLNQAGLLPADDEVERLDDHAL